MLSMDNPKRLLVLDIDGTVRHGRDELGHFVNSPDDVYVFPEAVAKMREWRQDGGAIVGVSNQGGVALGHVSSDEVHEAMERTYVQAESLFDLMLWCPHHPGAEDPAWARCWCRKPSIGLVVEGAIKVGVVRGESYPAHLGLMVGDRPEDQQCAEAAGLDFQWAADWRAS